MSTSGGSLLGIIPARGGSKGIPGKNTRLLAGRPLLAYTVDAARRSGIFTRLILTTDSPDIARIGRDLGLEVPFLRPPELAQDDSPMLPVMQHAVAWLEAAGFSPDLIALLQPTAPFRRPQDLIEARRLLEQHPEADSVVSVEPVPEHYAPHFVMRISDGWLLPFLPEGPRITRRQDAPKAYSRSGDFYFTRTRTLMAGNSIYGTRCLPFLVHHDHRVNLDSAADWAAAERLASQCPPLSEPADAS